MIESYMNIHFYWQVGLAIGALMVSIAPIASLLCLLNLCLAYVNDRKYTTPKILQHLYTKCCFDMEGIWMASFLGATLGCLAWPAVGTFTAGYSFLRLIRFMIRIKKGICKLVSNKKCLKDYTENDQPDMRF